MIGKIKHFDIVSFTGRLFADFFLMSMCTITFYQTFSDVKSNRILHTIKLYAVKKRVIKLLINQCTYLHSD